MNFAGLNVIVTPDTPKMKLGAGDYVTPEFRVEIDAWLLSFFGTTNLVPDGQYLVAEKLRQIYMNPRTLVSFKKRQPYG